MSTTTTDEAPTARLSLKWVIFAACILSLLLSFFAMPAFDDVAAHVGYMLRVTARIAFVFLLLAYVARPLSQVMSFQQFGLGAMLVRNRRYLGLSMAIAHTVHFGYVAYLVAVLEAPTDLLVLIFGGLAFVLMWLMAATSNDASMRYLKRQWKHLHTFGIHYLWLIFMQSFLPRALGVGEVGSMQPLYILLSVAGFAALALRIWAYRRSRLVRTT